MMEFRLLTLVLPVSSAAFSEDPWLKFGVKSIWSPSENQASQLNVHYESGHSESGITHGFQAPPSGPHHASLGPNGVTMQQQPDDLNALIDAFLASQPDEPEEHLSAQSIHCNDALDRADTGRKRSRLTENHIDDHQPCTIPEAHLNDIYPLITSFECNELTTELPPTDHSTWPHLNHQDNPLTGIQLTESHHSQDWMNFAHTFTPNQQVQHSEPYLLSPTHSQDLFSLMNSFESHEFPTNSQNTDHLNWSHSNHNNHPITEVGIAENFDKTFSSQSYIPSSHASTISQQVQRAENFQIYNVQEGSQSMEIFGSREFPTNFQQIDHSKSLHFNHENNPTEDNLQTEWNLGHRNKYLRSSPREIGRKINSQDAQSSISRETGFSEVGKAKTNEIPLVKAKLHIPPKAPYHLLRLHNVEVVNFKPFAIDGELMLTALNGLKRQDGEKFMNRFIDEIENKNKVICVVRQSRKAIKELITSFEIFFARSRQSSWSVEKSEDYLRPIATQGPKAIHLNNLQNSFNNFAFPSIYSSSNEKRVMKIREYSSFVMLLAQGIKTMLENKIKNNFGNDLVQADEKLEELRGLMSALPAYLFYVDLINTIIPVGELENGASLQTQREIATQRFFDVVDIILSKESKEERKLPNNANQKEVVTEAIEKFKRPGWNKRGAISFIWCIINYWILSSRFQLSVAIGATLAVNNNFKGFFNHLFVSWQLEY